MNKLLFALVGVAMTFNVFAAEYKNGVQYETLDKPASGQPQVTEFFSFYCGACFQFDQIHHVSQQIKEKVPQNGSYQKYHVSFMGGDIGVMLTKAWGIAMSLKIEEKIKPLMFEAVQVKRNIKSLDDIRNVFVQAGVSEQQFNSLWDSFFINSLLIKQQKEAESYKVNSIPAVYVNNKYRIINQSMDSADEFVNVANYLLTQ